jgi:NADP-dependent 3-hydroxy acid dehydrogenase YdfG
MTIELDVTNEQAIENAVQTVVDKWSTVDVLVNKYVDCSIN